MTEEVPASQLIRLSVVGSTGSIGQSTLSLAAAFPERLEIVALTANTSVEVLAGQIRYFRPRLAAVKGPAERAKLTELLSDLPSKPQIEIGPEGLELAAAESSADTVLSAAVGAAGLRPTWAAVKKGLKVALANKESLVLGGELIMPLAGGRLAPVDSEHSAIFQALGGTLFSPALRRVILTCSGGPFRGRTKAELEKVTREMALNHPTWSMGPKITCDSATLMNKGLEVIEAHHLFGLPFERIEVVIHPQSIVHSLAEFWDGSVMAQLGPADMRLAIAYALSHPQRWPLLSQAFSDQKLTTPAKAAAAGQAGAGPVARAEAYGNSCVDHLDYGRPFDFSGFKPITLTEKLLFEPPDRLNFPALDLAEQAGRAGGTAPAVLNGANEEAVTAFLNGRLAFSAIIETVAYCLDTLPAGPLSSIEEALAADAKSRQTAREYIASQGNG
ncbi:MAG: 1-deoxy-D-xylulose-5-phosphate reductoisomerase [Deltaproteobacteria bacterium]|nr:1-deoxy-D-xylulose-5-phosphate reductoisomerase [Deltaproteobacteria bacterium]